MSVMTVENKKIHPYKFTLWVAMGSILMMFAGFTSAYIVKRNQANWQGFELPDIFTYSTLVIVISSITMQLAVRNIRQRNMQAYRQLLLVTSLLGIAFIAMQWTGFTQLHERGIKLIGTGSNVSGSFLAVIAGMHMLHVAGGVVALLWMLRNALFSKTRTYTAVPAEIAAQYWHFVDLLWIYLFLFLHFVS